MFDVAVVLLMLTCGNVATCKLNRNARFAAVFTQPSLRHSATKTHKVPLHPICTKQYTKSGLTILMQLKLCFEPICIKQRQYFVSTSIADNFDHFYVHLCGANV